MPLPHACSLLGRFAACGGAASDSGDAHLPSTTTYSDKSCLSEVPSTSSSLPSVTSLNPSPLSLDGASYDCISTRGSAATALAICPSTNLLFSASASGISILTLSDLTPVSSSAASGGGSVKSIALLSGDSGIKILTSHQDGNIRIWRQTQSTSLKNHYKLQSTLPTTSDFLRHFPLPNSYNTVRRHKKRLWIQHLDAVSAIASTKELIYSVSWDKTLKIWRASDFKCLESVKAHDDAINAVVVARDGSVYTGSADRRIRVWMRGASRRRHGLVATLERHRSAVNALAVAVDGSVLYSGACDRSILVWAREDSAAYMVVVGALRGHGRAVLSLACCGELVVSGSGDRTVRIWRWGGVDGYSCLGVMEGHVRGVRSLAAVRVAGAEAEEEEEYRVCSGSLDGEVRVWRVRIPGLVESESSCSVKKIDS